MLVDKALDILRFARYEEITHVKKGNNLAQVVYLVAEGDDGNVCFYTQSTRAVRSNFGKYIKWCQTGDTKHLPAPIARKFWFTNTSSPLNWVRAFAKVGTFVDYGVRDKLLKAKYPEILAKERSDGPYVNVYKVSIKGDSRFKIIVSKDTPNKVVSQFVSKSKEQVYATYVTTAMNYRGWCYYHKDQLDSNNIEIELMAEGLVPGAGKLWAKLYLDSANPTLILNSKW